MKQLEQAVSVLYSRPVERGLTKVIWGFIINILKTPIIIIIIIIK